MGLNHRRGLSNVVSMIEDELCVRETERGGVVGAPRPRAQLAQRTCNVTRIEKGQRRGPDSTRFAAARAKAAAACATLG